MKDDAIRVLDENNIKFDFIAGTSVGSVIGSMYAAGKKSDEILKVEGNEVFMNATRSNHR